MLKEKAVARLGQDSLLMPAWVQAALGANDRIKLHLSLLQEAHRHAVSPDEPVPDWGADITRLGGEGVSWLHDLVRTAYLDGQQLVIARQSDLLQALEADLALMARPVCAEESARARELAVRRDRWIERLRALQDDEGLDPVDLRALTHGQSALGDSLHLLVMDLHKALDAIAREMATEEIDGAHVWQIDESDRVLIRAFMRGLARTAPLKFSHPGLDTAATRAGSRLLIQNDIGTNDVHVLVVEVEAGTVTVTYSDLHAGRFAFFRRLLAELGFHWTVSEPRRSEELNAGRTYHLGTAAWTAAAGDTPEATLEALGSRIVFVIDWNRARKRLLPFVSKAEAVDILAQAARHEWGHMGWLLAGGDRLVYAAMQGVETEAFRVGDRLDDVLGEAAAGAYLLDLMRVCSQMMCTQQPVGLMADEARMLLARALRQRSFEFDLLAEHAAFCHALADSLCESLGPDEGEVPSLREERLARAKAWERQADHLLMEARQRAERQARWRPVVHLLDRADDVADALEEAGFVLSLTQVPPLAGLPAPVREPLERLAQATLAAIQDHVRAIEMARHLNEGGDASDAERFLQTLWRMLRAERQCDELARQARRAAVAALHDQPGALVLAGELAGVIEQASDALLAAGHGLRGLAIDREGGRS